MVSPVTIAFLVDVFAALMSQVGLILQKLAHRHQETKIESNLQESPMLKSTVKKETEGDQSDSIKDEVIVMEVDQNETRKAYCSWRFIMGIFCLATGSVIHVFVLPFLDLTLIAVNATLGIIFSVTLSSCILKE